MAAISLDENGLPEGYPFDPEWEMSPRQVKAMLDAGEDFVLLDCRTPPEFDHCRIEGAIFLPLQEVGRRLAELEPACEKKIVIHCHHGMRSLQMASFLRQRGFSDVTSMAGGIDLWSMDIDPGVARY
ncbi:MAG: rhodanese-like domain-containing protein [Phycisphaeraceae bacterium]